MGRVGRIVVVVALVASACSSSPTATVTYRVDGDVDTARVTFGPEDQPTTETVDLPWAVVDDVGSEFAVSLVVENLGDEGSVACTVEVERVPPASATGEVSASCTASGTIEGSRTDVAMAAFGEDRPRDPAAPFAEEALFVDLAGNPSSVFGPSESFELQLPLRQVTDEIRVSIELLSDGTRVSQSEVLRGDDLPDRPDGVFVVPFTAIEDWETGDHPVAVDVTVTDLTGAFDEPYEDAFRLVFTIDPDRAVPLLTYEHPDGVFDLRYPATWVVAQDVELPMSIVTSAATDRAVAYDGDPALFTLTTLRPRTTPDVSVVIVVEPAVFTAPGFEEWATLQMAGLEAGGFVFSERIESEAPWGPVVSTVSETTSAMVRRHVGFLTEAGDRYYAVAAFGFADAFGAFEPDAASILDSVTFAASAPPIPPLADMRTVQLNLTDEGQPSLDIDVGVPADWVLEPLGFDGDLIVMLMHDDVPVDRREFRLLARLLPGAATVPFADASIAESAQLAAEFAVVSRDDGSSLGGVPAVAWTWTLGSRIIHERSVVVGDWAIRVQVEARDELDDPALATAVFEAIGLTRR